MPTVFGASLFSAALSVNSHGLRLKDIDTSHLTKGRLMNAVARWRREELRPFPCVCLCCLSFFVFIFIPLWQKYGRGSSGHHLISQQHQKILLTKEFQMIWENKPFSPSQLDLGSFPKNREWKGKISTNFTEEKPGKCCLNQMTNINLTRDIMGPLPTSWWNVMRRALHLWFSFQKPMIPVFHEENIRQTQSEGQSIQYPINTPQNCRGHEIKMMELSKTRGGMKTKCNVVPWDGSWSR